MFEGVRKGDVALAAVLTALGVVLMVENITAVDPDVRDRLALVAHGAGLRRRDPARSCGGGANMLAVTLVSTAAMAAHVLAFGWVVRCGAGLPLAFALAYGVGRLAPRWQSWVGLVVTLVLQVLVLVQDSAAGLHVIPVTALIGVAAWGVGVWVRQRVGTAVAAPA